MSWSSRARGAIAHRWLTPGKPSPAPSRNRPGEALQRALCSQFRILGPLEALRTTASRSRSEVRSSARRARALLLHANHVVSTDRLVDALWGEQPPRTATTSLQNVDLARSGKCSAPTRSSRSLRATGSTSTRTRSISGASSACVAQARELGRRSSGPSTLREALALWRGDAARRARRTSRSPQSEMRRLEELRLRRARRPDRRRARARAGTRSSCRELEALVARASAARAACAGS